MDLSDFQERGLLRLEMKKQSSVCTDFSRVVLLLSSLVIYLLHLMHLEQ